MQKRVSSTLVLSLIAGMLSACGGGSSDGNSMQAKSMARSAKASAPPCVAPR